MLRTKEGRQGRFLNTTGSWESFSKLPESLLNIHSVLRAGKACEWNKTRSLTSESLQPWDQGGDGKERGAKS